MSVSLITGVLTPHLRHFSPFIVISYYSPKKGRKRERKEMAGCHVALSEQRHSQGRAERRFRDRFFRQEDKNNEIPQRR